MLVLETARLILREFELSDAEAMDRVFGDAEVMRFGDGVKTREQVMDWLQDCLASYQERGFGPWAVIEKVQQQMKCALIIR